MKDKHGQADSQPYLLDNYQKMELENIQNLEVNSQGKIGNPAVLLLQDQLLREKRA